MSRGVFVFVFGTSEGASGIWEGVFGTWEEVFGMSGEDEMISPETLFQFNFTRM